MKKVSRGTLLLPSGRYLKEKRKQEDLFYEENLFTEVFIENPKKIINKNTSEDICFSYSINPYQGCEHGCIYCYARPTHAYWDLSPGLDFERKIFVKINAPDLLKKEFQKKTYSPSPIVIGANTDPYQPLEKKYQITRKLLEVFWEFLHPLSIITKSSLILRDIDLLEKLAKKNLCVVYISISSLKLSFVRSIEKRASSSRRRLEVIKELSQRGIPVGVMCAPIIPGLNDEEVEKILALSRKKGARWASYTWIRLPYEVKEIFYEGIKRAYPLRWKKVQSLIRGSRRGKDYVAIKGIRMQGEGEYARVFQKRFLLACKRLGFNQEKVFLDTSLFSRKPQRELLLFKR